MFSIHAHISRSLTTYEKNRNGCYAAPISSQVTTMKWALRSTHFVSLGRHWRARILFPNAQFRGFVECYFSYDLNMFSQQIFGVSAPIPVFQVFIFNFRGHKIYLLSFFSKYLFRVLSIERTFTAISEIRNRRFLKKQGAFWTGYCFGVHS